MSEEDWPRNPCTMDFGHIKLVHPAMLYEHEVAALHKMVEIAGDYPINDDVTESGLFKELFE